MRDTIIKALMERFRAYDDLVKSSSDETIALKLDVPKNKSLMEHLWCVVGARESYAKALTEGSWSGFSCSLSNYSKKDFTEKLTSSAEEVISSITNIEDWTTERDELLLTLSEHEVMHEGQIIRHLHGLEIEIPATVKWA